MHVQIHRRSSDDVANLLRDAGFTLEARLVIDPVDDATAGLWGAVRGCGSRRRSSPPPDARSRTPRPCDADRTRGWDARQILQYPAKEQAWAPPRTAAPGQRSSSSTAPGPTQAA